MPIEIKFTVDEYDRKALALISDVFSHLSEGVIEDPPRVEYWDTSTDEPLTTEKLRESIEANTPEPDTITTVEATGLGISKIETTEVDAKGRAWDSRIHASSRALLAKTGEWRLKRGVDKELVAEIQGTTQPDTQIEIPGEIPGPPSAPSNMTYAELCQLVRDSGLTLADANEIADGVGCFSISYAAVKPEYIPKIAEAIRASL